MSNGKGWHYLAVKRLPALSRGITSKHSDFYHLNCLHSFTIEKKKIQSHKKLIEIKDFYNVIMPFEDTELLDLTNIKNLIKHHLLFMQILNV